MKPYTPSDWYWYVGGDKTKVYSSAVGDYVPNADPTFQAWVAGGGIATNIANEAELGEVLAVYSLRPVAPGVLDGYKEAQATGLTVEVVAKALFFLANEVRALQAKPALTAAQFKAFLKGLM